MKGLGEVKETARGFEIIEFKDRYGEECSLQQSSLASENAVWLGCNNFRMNNLTGTPISPRMHLNEDQVKALIESLQCWLDTLSFKQ